MIGKRLAHYKIVEQLGHGGMGEVYLAEDTRLGRRVAIKILPPSLAGDSERRARFEREARTIATLNHPNIVTLYAVEEADGELFLTMEHVTGESLQASIPAQGLPLSRVFDIAIALADALAAAHDKGIVHRDLKPANIMLTAEGRVKVLDFGVAKLLQGDAPADAATLAETELAHTSAGVILGTAAYMSPEQAEGKAVDARSDIFSFGIVLYEMITGQRPFQGNSAVATLSAILRDTPRDIREMQANLPRHLARIVENCLAKEPDRRTQTALDVRNELEKLRHEILATSSGSVHAPEMPAPRGKRGVLLAIGFSVAFAFVTIAIMRPALRSPTRDTGSDVADRKSIAVLPFTNMSADPDNEYFSDGLAETLLHRLAQISDLRVAARTSSFSFKGSDKDIVDIAKQLNVANILEGSVQKSGNRLRITVQLINASDGSHLLSRSFDKNDTDVFAVQDEIADQVVSALRVQLLDRERSTLERRDTESLEAYNAYLLGLQRINKESWENLEEAVAFFERAVELDPNYAPAWAGMARAQLDRYSTGAVGPEIFADVERMLDRALAIDPECSDALIYRGFLMAHQGHVTEAEELMDRAARLSPNSSQLAQQRAGLAISRLQVPQALQFLQRSVDLDPLNARVLGFLAVGHETAGNFDSVRLILERIRAIDPDMPRLYYVPAYLAYAVEGRVDVAARLMQQAIDKDPADHELQAALAETYIDMRTMDKANAILGELTQAADVSSVVRATEVLALQRQGDIESAARIAAALVWNSETAYRHGSRLQLIRAAVPVMNSARALQAYEQLFPQLLFQGPTTAMVWIWPGRPANEFARACADYARLLLASSRPEDAALALQRAEEIRLQLPQRGRQGWGTLAVQLSALRGNTDMAMQLLQQLFDEAPTMAFWWDLQDNPNLESLRALPAFTDISVRYEALMDEQRVRFENGDLP